ncbi:CD276 antigen-like [Sebastes fasciatus]|uniref:CD276 antigen-like n=1 Tax=Sebastes fasciatus TaxID=394691 RepID=UPI003D9FA864
MLWVNKVFPVSTTIQNSCAGVSFSLHHNPSHIKKHNAESQGHRSEQQLTSTDEEEEEEEEEAADHLCFLLLVAVESHSLVLYVRRDSRMKMICSILLLLSLTSCVSGAFVVNVTQTSYQAEENHDITLEWMFTPRTNSSPNSLNILCQLFTELKYLVLFHLYEGVEDPESLDEQFKGRVRWDKDVLRDGRIRLYMSRLRINDSGVYMCEVLTGYGSGSRICHLKVTGAFVVNVEQTSYQAEENHNITLEWMFTPRTNSSPNALSILCRLFADLKTLVLFHLHEGVELPESQNKQFAGRVRWDKDVLRDGRIRLHMSRLRINDSGRYRCEVLTLYGGSYKMCHLKVTGPFVVHVEQDSYEAEENHNITLEWMFPTRTNSSSQSVVILCYLLAERKASVLFHLHGGVEVPESQDEQFTGRVRWDKDVLRDGRIRFNMSRLRIDDSGRYMCDVQTGDGRSSEMCHLKVTAAADEPKPPTPTMRPQPERPTMRPQPERPGSIGLSVIVGLTAVVLVLWAGLCIVFLRKRTRRTIRGNMETDVQMSPCDRLEVLPLTERGQREEMIVVSSMCAKT